MAVEEPKFTLISKDGAFEVRDYPGLVVAEATVKGDRNAASSAGFRILASYIFGANAGKASIAMTAPVQQTAAGDRIAMTAPVAISGTADEWVVRFTMPSQYDLAQLPRPNDGRVHLKEIPPVRMAVLKFSGLARDEAVAERTTELQTRLKARQLVATEPASLARYDPPWTPWFMRRNEVMIPVAKDGHS